MPERIERIPLDVRKSDEWLENFRKKGRRPAPDFPWRVYGGRDLDLVRPDGSLLAALRVGVRGVPPAVCRHCWDGVGRAVHFSDHRGGAESGTVGWWRMHGCEPKLTRWSSDKQHQEDWRRVQVLLREMDVVFRRECPAHYEARREAVRGCPYLVPGTTFTTATVNRDADFDAHTDKGNLLAGLEVVTALRSGVYTGGLLGIPRYLVAFDLHTGDVLLADLHGEYHCNTAIVGDAYERLTGIAYARDE
jgi:hypothetical protein